jgi:hypothetical protein
LIVVADGAEELTRISQQGFEQLNCVKAMETLDGENRPPTAAGFEELVRVTGEWFGEHLAVPEHAGST